MSDLLYVRKTKYQQPPRPDLSTEIAACLLGVVEILIFWSIYQG